MLLLFDFEVRVFSRDSRAGGWADEYEVYNYEVGIRPLIEKAVAVQTFREDRDDETEFVTISYWESAEAMSAFTGGDPTEIHHLPRDSEFLVELPERVQILRLRHSHGWALAVET